MFTLKQIDAVHARAGTMRRFAASVKELRGLGVCSYNSYLTDGHSEYFDDTNESIASVAAHKRNGIAQVADREELIRHLDLHKRGKRTTLKCPKVWLIAE